MATHQRHHYVPQFYLRSWVGADGKLACYSWLRGAISVSRLSPKSVAYENGLYSLEHGPGERRQILERDFLAKVDEDAAKALQSMQATGTAYLDPQARAHWAVFLLSMRVRSPPSVRDVRTQATADLLEVLKEDPEEYDRLRKPDDPPTLEGWLRKYGPGAIENYGVLMLPNLIQHGKLVGHIYRMHWWVQRIAGKAEFLTSDHPCVYTKGFGDPNCVVALPLSPSLVFYAVNRPELEDSFRRRPHEALAVRTNQSVVSQAMKYVYGTRGNRRLFVKKHLKKLP